MTTQPQTNHTPNAAARYWRLPAVKTYTGRSRSAIYRDTTFPKPVKLGPNTSAWIAEEVRAWCEQRDAEAVAARAEPHPRAALMLAAKRARAAGVLPRLHGRFEKG